MKSSFQESVEQSTRITGLDPDERMQLGGLDLSRSPAWAVLQAVAYADVFDYPLRVDEAHRYGVGPAAPRDEAGTALAAGSLFPQRLQIQRGYLTLPGREYLVMLRQRREQVAARMWPQAMCYGLLIARLPFVRMVAVTGALAVDNVESGADLDYLIVTRRGRLWLCRALVILVVHLAARQGIVICPNYFLTEDSLVFNQRDLYTAHEIAQMVPLAGLPTYHRLRRLNRWTLDLLPNSEGAPPCTPPLLRSSKPPLGKRLGETVLSASLIDPLERWEMDRKIRKFTAQRKSCGEADFTPDWCKGHFDGHAGRTLAAYAERLQHFMPDGQDTALAADPNPVHRPMKR